MFTLLHGSILAYTSGLKCSYSLECIFLDFENYLGQMYPAELEIKDTTESYASATYFDLLLLIGWDGQLCTTFYDKRDDFNFHITNYPFLGSNIPSSPIYGVFYLTAHTV